MFEDVQELSSEIAFGEMYVFVIQAVNPNGILQHNLKLVSYVSKVSCPLRDWDALWFGKMNKLY